MIFFLLRMIYRMESKDKTRSYGNNSDADLNFSCTCASVDAFTYFLVRVSKADYVYIPLFFLVTCPVSNCAHIVSGCC